MLHFWTYFRGELKLAQFGLASLYDEKAEPPASSSLASTEQRMVSLWYRAPELLLGEKKSSPATDIWSCGSVCVCVVCMRAGIHVYIYVWVDVCVCIYVGMSVNSYIALFQPLHMQGAKLHWKTFCMQHL